MTRRAQNLNSLVRGRIRPSMNKYNLFNLYKKSKPNFRIMTLYQQKWASKQETRAYHGEHIKEHRWQSLFEKKLKGVAQLDASLKGNVPSTPMVLQTFASLEKRLDYSIFRALFSSSVRQAKKFILNGHVKVNGVIIKHPNFNLNPGDIFSVDPERVLEALGSKKPNLKESYKIDKLQIINWQNYVNNVKNDPRKIWEKKLEKQKKLNSLYKNLNVNDNFNSNNLINNDDIERKKNMQDYKLKKLREIQNSIDRKSILNDIIKTNPSNSIDDFKSQFGDKLSTKAFQIYQLIPNSIKNLQTDSDLSKELLKIIPIYKDGKPIGEIYDDTNSKKIRSQLSELHSEYLEKIRQDFQEKPLAQDELIKIWSENLKKHPTLPPFNEVEEKGSYYVKLPWQRGMFGLANPNKSYFTPWKPRQFLPVFSVLPKHLEISFKTCHAVYLRDPVARPGESEVISPFDEDIHERSYMYYIKNGM
ncbi:mitochondrial 37S ribosomal protein nam9 [Pichia californica]|uniref:Small ribosomal subunit protein uS4m n=1 Tax=Pichia californica TaxID=460514 RepID=A0A9P6WMR6_9ASCO|nr:mitochondrial 37S ribosomal protein nam9 [[Candida] californica]KAG0689985.1 mitochondrial 37S ribosomal protein nam9 [[Candida] californica]